MPIIQNQILSSWRELRNNKRLSGPQSNQPRASIEMVMLTENCSVHVVQPHHSPDAPDSQDRKWSPENECIHFSRNFGLKIVYTIVLPDSSSQTGGTHSPDSQNSKWSPENDCIHFSRNCDLKIVYTIVLPDSSYCLIKHFARPSIEYGHFFFVFKNVVHNRVAKRQPCCRLDLPFDVPCPCTSQPSPLTSDVKPWQVLTQQL